MSSAIYGPAAAARPPPQRSGRARAAGKGPMQLRRGLMLCAGIAVMLAGCDAPRHSLLAPGQPPDVQLTAKRVEHATSGPVTYRFSWFASAHGGRVESYLWAVGSPAEDDDHLTWERTADAERTLTFARGASRVASPAAASGSTEGGPVGRVEPRVFTLYAVDGAGQRSAPAKVAMFEGNIAPSVWITNPPPNRLVRYYVCPTTRFDWDGSDPDGIQTNRPVKYKFKMLTDQTEVTVATARTDPDSVRRFYAPLNWAGWDSTSADTTYKSYTNLTPNQEYVFVVTCFDEVGDYDPVFNFDHNMIYMRVTYASTQFPRIGMFNAFFMYEYTTGRFDPAPALKIDAPAGQPITLNWYALPIADNAGNPVSGPIRGYRWALDIKDLSDETPRRDEATELDRWSQWSLLTTSVTLPPFQASASDPESHTFYIEAMGDLCAGASLPALGVVRLDAARPGFAKDLLIVDDTRLALDKVAINTNCYAAANRPIGNWPTQAELDTFLYAVGGKPWKCYPGGAMSTPGIFNGYAFDTLGTNLRVADLTIPLSTLNQYRHVIWLVDGSGALNSKPGTDLGDLGGPMTSMRYMNGNARANSVAAYIAGGGRVWLAGGGAATASMINFNRGINDNSLPNPRTLTFRNTDNELIPGRFIYDQAHWRSEFKQFKVNGGHIRRYLGRFESTPGIYGDLPAEIQVKSNVTDPFPPNRTGQSLSVFYQTQFDVEFLSAANEILEYPDSSPFEGVSTLDTLFKVTASALQPETVLQSVAMTYYHGADNTPLVTTGFNIWSFQRTQCIALVDFVLQQLWGLTPNPAVPSAIGPESPRVPLGRLKPAAPEAGIVRGANRLPAGGQGMRQRNAGP
jgi:hypothetical protein